MSDRIPEDLERAPLVVDEGPVVERAPVAEPTTPLEWVRANLFYSWLSTLLTLLSAAFAAWAGYRLLRFVFVTGDWGVFKANLRVYMVGRFPLDEIWRVWASLYLVVVLAGVSWGASGVRLRWNPRMAVFRAGLATAFVLLLVYLLDGVRIWVLIAAAGALYAAAVAGGRATGRRARPYLVVAWVLVFPTVILLLRAFGGVRPILWSGFLLNVLVAVVAIFASFPLGILLALGRRNSPRFGDLLRSYALFSVGYLRWAIRRGERPRARELKEALGLDRLPVIGLFSIGVIELIRGVPLITLLIFGQFILPLILPPDLRLPDIIRAMVMITVFSSAYVAEIVRGGLQSVDRGQYEAARALGLSTPRMMALIVLPQALRNTIPAMIGHFISLFKDTSLLAVVAGFSDLLRTARRASRAFEFIGRHAEALIPAAVIFFVVAFSMSRWSQRLERRLGVGER